MVIDVSRIKRAKLLAGLFNNTKPFDPTKIDHNDLGRNLSVEEARTIIKTRLAMDGKRGLYFDYLLGRPLKIDLSGDVIDPLLYNRYAGEGTAERVIRELVNAK